MDRSRSRWPSFAFVVGAVALFAWCGRSDVYGPRIFAQPQDGGGIPDAGTDGGPPDSGPPPDAGCLAQILPAGIFQVPTVGPQATVLATGDVLIVGGRPDDAGIYGPALPQVRRYVPSANAFLDAGWTSQPRWAHFQTRLPDGRVVVAGGAADGTNYTLVEAYDPSRDAWSVVGALPPTVPAIAGEGALLSGYRLIVARGYPLSTRAAIVVLDGGLSSETTPAPLAAFFGAGASLPSDRLLATGGFIDGGSGTFAATPRAFLFDAPTQSWTELPAMAVARAHHTATVLNDGTVLVVGGYVDTAADVTGSTELFDPSTRTWRDAGTLRVPRSSHTATKLPDGTVLVIGGAGPGNVAVEMAERFDPATHQWTDAGLVDPVRALHAAALLGDGTVLVVGGVGPGNSGVAQAVRYVPCR